MHVRPPKILLTLLCLAVAGVSLGDVLGGRPLSWDLSNLVPLDYNKKYSLKDPLLKALQEGETERVRSQSVQRMSKSGEDMLAAWCYVQAARLKKDGTGMLSGLSLNQKLDPDSPAVLYARIKCSHLALVEANNAADTVRQLTVGLEKAGRLVAEKYSDNLPLLLTIGFRDGIGPGEIRRLFKEYLDRRPDDLFAQIAHVRSLTHGPISFELGKDGKIGEMRPYFLGPDTPKPIEAIAAAEKYLKVHPGTPEIIFTTAYAHYLLGDIASARKACQSVLANSKAPQVLRDRSEKFLRNPVLSSLRPTIDV
jgi:hypothetical protein